MRALVMIGMLWPGIAAAETWVQLSGADITALLSDASVTYIDASQSFTANGFTTYVDDRTSEGHWRVTGDQYCSVWPPSDRWVCYDVTLRGDEIRFIGPDQSVSQGVVER